MTYKTEQEAFWAGDFGAGYIERNGISPRRLACTTNLWSAILQRVLAKPASVLELGTNIGANMHVLNMLLPEAKLSGVEINHIAAETLRQWGKAEVYETSILDFSPTQTWEMVFTSGVLVHIAPEYLSQIYELMHKASSKYICMVEYYNPTPDEVVYRGHAGKLYRRDFAGDIMAMFPDLTLRGYGFVYKNDPVFPLGDPTWFIMEKR